MKNQVSSSIIPLRPISDFIKARLIVIIVRENMAEKAAFCRQLICTVHNRPIGNNKTGRISGLLKSQTSNLMTYSGNLSQNHTQPECEGLAESPQRPELGRIFLENVTTSSRDAATYLLLLCFPRPHGNNSTNTEMKNPETVSAKGPTTAPFVPLHGTQAFGKNPETIT